MIFTLIQVKICPKKTNSSAVTKLHNDLDLMSGQIQFWAEVSVDLCYESSSTRTSALHVNRRCHSRAEPGLLDLSGLWSGAADRQTWRLMSSSSSSSSAGLRAEHTDLMSAVFPLNPPQRKGQRSQSVSLQRVHSLLKGTSAGRTSADTRASTFKFKIYFWHLTRQNPPKLWSFDTFLCKINFLLVSTVCQTNKTFEH